MSASPRFRERRQAQLWKIHIEGVNLLRTGVAGEESRVVRAGVAPGAKLREECAKALQAEKNFRMRIAEPHCSNVGISASPVLHVAAVSGPSRVSHPVSVGKPLRPLSGIEIVEQKLL